MKDWWETLQSRERYMVLIATVLVSIAILYLAIWSPIASSRDTKQKRVEAKRETVTWMTQKKQEVEHLKRINPNMFNSASDSRSLLAIVDTGAKQMGIRPAITRIEPKGEDSVHIYVEDMAFDYLIVLLGELERRNNIEVADASFNRSDQIGKITGKVTLTR
ncbi:MAG: type II secretion system protein M [Gammaproteobacteria bacterium]|nr:type II secretion system protein M [Gammaproteobacteria bacterium]